MSDRIAGLWVALATKLTEDGAVDQPTPIRRVRRLRLIPGIPRHRRLTTFTLARAHAGKDHPGSGDRRPPSDRAQSGDGGNRDCHQHQREPVQRKPAPVVL